MTNTELPTLGEHDLIPEGFRFARLHVTACAQQHSFWLMDQIAGGDIKVEQSIYDSLPWEDHGVYDDEEDYYDDEEDGI